MKGVFEVHLITDYEHQTQLFGYILDLKNPALINPRPTCAHAKYGNYPIQPMLTFKCHGEFSVVKSLVDSLFADMTNSCNNIPIYRVKIEAMAHNEGVPAICEGDNYFEFHFKVPIVNTYEWNDVAKLVIPFGGHLFYNPYNKTLNPIVTIRRYTSLEDLEEVFQQINEILESRGFTPTSPEKEYSAYDSNVYMDCGWLFEGKPTNMVTDISDKMLFI